MHCETAAFCFDSHCRHSCSRRWVPVPSAFAACASVSVAHLCRFWFTRGDSPGWQRSGCVAQRSLGTFSSTSETDRWWYGGTEEGPLSCDLGSASDLWPFHRNCTRPPRKWSVQCF